MRTKRNRWWAKVVFQSKAYRVVGKCYGTKYNKDTSGYTFEKSNGQDAMGDTVWVRTDDLDFRAIANSMAYGIEKMRARR